MPRRGLADMLLCVAAAPGGDAVSVDMLWIVEKRCEEGDRARSRAVR